MRPRPAAGTAHRGGSSVVELALDLQRRAGNRSVTELVGRTVGGTRTLAGTTAAARGQPVAMQREPCTDCPDAGATGTPDPTELTDPASQE